MTSGGHNKLAKPARWIRIDDKVWKAGEKLAAARGEPMSIWVSEAIRQRVERDKTGK